VLNIKMIENTPYFRPRPKSIPGYHQFTNGSFIAFVHEEQVLKKMAQWARQWRHAEIAGRLVGRVYRDEEGFWCVVTGIIPADVTGGPTSVQTTEKDAAHTVRALDERHPAEDLLGWYHSHPFALDNYSSPDRANQAQWGKPYHLGLLIALHPDRVKIHAFRGPESERLRDSCVVPNAQLIAKCQAPDAKPTTYAPTERSCDCDATNSDRSLLHFAWAVVLIVILFAVEESSRRQWQAVDTRLQRLQVTTKKVQTEVHKQTRLLQNRQEDEQTESNESSRFWIGGTATKILQSLEAVMLENSHDADASQLRNGNSSTCPSYPEQSDSSQPELPLD
jgi:proteasome lid subunit RPN8/RPN11